MSTIYWRAAAFSPRTVHTLLGRHDAAWPALVRRLAELRAARRHSVRLVEAGEGSGPLLIRAAKLARTLGFTSVEARCIGATDAAAINDPAIGFTVENVDPLRAVRDEAAFPADILVWRTADAAIDPAVLAAADVVITEPLAMELIDVAA